MIRFTRAGNGKRYTIPQEGKGVRVTVSQQETEALRKMVRDFAQERVAPRVAAYDADERISRDLLEEMADLGLFGGAVSPEFGGLGLDYVTYAQIIEKMSKVCHIMGVLMSMPTSLVGAGLAEFGTEEQQRTYLRPLAEGRLFGAAGVTEPRSGSDVAGMQTCYRKDGDSFVITGAKAWPSNLDIADFYITFATIDRSLRHAGISAFLISRGTPGVTTNPYKNKLGFRPLCIGDLILDEVRIGPEGLIGEEGQGFQVAMTAVERGRLSVAARAVGLATAAMTDAITYAQSREAFGSTIDHFQIVQSKMYALDIAQRTSNDSMQIHGAAGVSPEYRVGRLYRDAKVFQIVEGSNDLHRAIIAEMELGLRKKN